jgi:hypothetical protein
MIYRYNLKKLKRDYLVLPKLIKGFLNNYLTGLTKYSPIGTIY